MKKIKNILTIGENVAKSLQTTLTPKTANGVKSGSLVYFVYEKQEVLAMVLSIKRGARGLFLSTQGNRLLAVVKLNHVSMLAIHRTAEVLARRPDLATYENLKRGLSVIFGSDKVRTYNLAKMVHFMEINYRNAG